MGCLQRVPPGVRPVQQRRVAHGEGLQLSLIHIYGAQVFADGVQIDREVYSHLAIRRLAKTVTMFPNMHLALFDRTKSCLLYTSRCV